MTRIIYIRIQNSFYFNFSDFSIARGLLRRQRVAETVVAVLIFHVILQTRDVGVLIRSGGKIQPAQLKREMQHKAAVLVAVLVGLMGH